MGTNTQCHVIGHGFLDDVGSICNLDGIENTKYRSNFRIYRFDKLGLPLLFPLD